jgi:hypothetical protein
LECKKIPKKTKEKKKGEKKNKKSQARGLNLHICPALFFFIKMVNIISTFYFLKNIKKIHELKKNTSSQPPRANQFCYGLKLLQHD